MTEDKGIQFKIGQYFRRREHQIGLLTGVTVLALLIAFWNAAATRRELEYSTQEYCQEITAQMREAVNSSIDAKMIELVNVADSISRVFDDDDTAALEEFLGRKADILEFDALFLLNRNGDVAARMVEEGIELDDAALKERFDRNPSLWEESHVGFIEGQMLLYSAAVYMDGEADYVLLGICGQETMQRIISSSAFQGKTLSCVVDSHGGVLLAPTDLKPFSDLESIFESQDENEKKLAKLQADMEEGRAGSLQFTSITGRKNLLSYNPLQDNAWFLLTIVPVDLVSGSLSSYFVRTLLVTLGLSLVFMLFLLLLYRINDETQKKLSRLAYEDDITGGMNNAAFRLKYRQVLREQRLNRPALLLLNVRRFKLINEKLGFMAGNNVLRMIEQEVRERLDEKSGEFAARSETDNFFLCLNERSPERIQARVQAIEEAINRRLNDVYPGTRLSFAVGCCLVEDNTTDVRILQDRARIAVREEKVADIGGCTFYSGEITERIKWEQTLEAMFDASLADGSFRVYLQPKVNLRSGRLSGAEALVRWNHPKMGMIPPAKFIPLLERSGKICRLDLYVFEAVCDFYRRRKEQGMPWYPVSVNLSRYHFYEDGFLDEFQAVRKRYGLPDGSIEFELTESMFFDREHNERIKKGIAQMHQLGFRCSMDDFGSGYSSLGTLKEFDVDTIKMDRSFFLDMDSEKARDIIRSVVELASKLQMETVAEGIEQTEQMEFLHAIRCDTVQGYCFSKPLPMDEFESWADRFETGNNACKV